MTGKDTNHWQGKERIQTIDREGYKPLVGKGEDTNLWQGKESINLDHWQEKDGEDANQWQ